LGGSEWYGTFIFIYVFAAIGLKFMILTIIGRLGFVELP